MIYTPKLELNDPNQIKMAYNGGYKFYKTEKINIIKQFDMLLFHSFMYNKLYLSFLLILM